MMNTQIKLSFNLIFHTVALALTFILCISISAQAETPTKAIKSAETYFTESLNCLKKADRICAQVAAAKIPSQSAYSQILQGLTAALDGDFDTTFRTLLPLQADNTLSPQASASLHASLALAYENQNDPLRTLEQRVLAESALSIATPLNVEDINSNQANIWEALSVLSTNQLVEMRGKSLDTNTQGWIDLALAAKFLDDGENNEKAIEQWRRAYKDHPANKGIAATLFPPSETKAPALKVKLNGAVALVLPFSNPYFYPATDAIERGFMAAKSIAGDNASVKIYPTQTNAESVLKAQQKAIVEGAQYILGPLTSTRTLTLSKANGQASNLKQLTYGLSEQDEVAQIIKKARNLGMQKVTVISANNDENIALAALFTEKWLALGGESTTLMSTAAADELKKQLTENPADMILMLTDTNTARSLRSALPTNLPTFSVSAIYSGTPSNEEDAPLKGIRFTDMPWLIDRENTAFSAYKKAAEDLPPGEMQRWFALGADAYQILIALEKLSQEKSPQHAVSIKGLTGQIEISTSGEISRSAAFASFGTDSVVLETSR